MSLNGLGQTLLSAVNQFAGVGDNTPSSVDVNLVADLASQIGADNSAHRSYIEDGVTGGGNFPQIPRALQIMMQVPDVTILVKKRQFSSLSENWRYDLMNSDEQLFTRAAKRLFYNKSRVIAAYEQLTKIDQIVSNSGIVSDFFFPLVLSAVDTINSISPGLIDASTQNTFDAIRQVKEFSNPSPVTTWLIDGNSPFASPTGEGTGVLELTNIASFSCTSSVEFGAGRASLSFEDPYKLMVITNNDIDQALADATSATGLNNFFRLSEQTLSDTVNQLRTQLNEVRTSKGKTNIIFSINQDSLIFKKVRAFIDGEGREINFNYDGGFVGFGASASVDSSATEGVNGLSSDEITLFTQTVQNIYNLLALEQSTQAETLTLNQQTNYVRRKLRLHYGGKNLIQPMDVIHIFISSKTQSDDFITQGLNFNFSSISLTGAIEGALSNVTSAVNNISAAFGGTPSGQQSYFEVEKDLIAGSDFPSWLWMLMRNNFTQQSAGTHVFAGVVSGEPTHTYNNGKYIFNVSVSDNTEYFKFGQININPATDVFNGDLYDPLTPFNINFDAATGFAQDQFPPLLDENVRLLTSGSIKASNGRFRGLAVDQTSYAIQDPEQIANGLFRRKLNDPFGFVYRWKEGIGSLTLSGEPHGNAFGDTVAPPIQNDPFAGQDFMNVLSLLITGKPYNYNTFLQSALVSANLSKDDLNNSAGTSSFYQSLLNQITKTNQTWGNFLPFKSLIISDQGYAFLRSGQFDLTVANQALTQLNNQRAQLFDQLTSLVPQLANNPQFYKVSLSGTPAATSIDIDAVAKLGKQIIDLDQQIATQEANFNQQFQLPNLQSSQGSISIFGNDISFDPTVAPNNSLTPSQTSQSSNDFQDQISALTQRRLWKVKANNDYNLFIVDDSYDKNYDLQTFEASFRRGFDNFRSDYKQTFELIGTIKDTFLGFEVFADSQGHIQARPPQYNKIPSSVFYQMIQQKATNGIQIFPDFLESLFVNQIEGLTNQIEVIEDQIRIRCAVLGATNDTSAEKILNGSVMPSGGSSQFLFATDSTGTLAANGLRSLLVASDPDTQATQMQAASGILNDLQANISGALTATVNFDIVAQTNLINNATSFGGVNSTIVSYINLIAARIQQNSGQPAPTLQSLLSTNRIASGGGVSQTDLLNITTQVSSFISERQSLIKLLANAIKNLDQGITLNTNPSNLGQNNLFSPLNTQPSPQFPEILQHMIEDETVDDIGPGSGSRYIIKDSQILSMSIGEASPPWTIVEVNGSINNNQVPLPSTLSIGSGGNAISTAFAADYDMWRMYGFRSAHPVNARYLSDPDSQCAPFAVYLLNLARKNIFHGTVSVIGNEYMQPGEVYYIQDRDSLFYSKSVTHSFTYGGEFQTTLELTYGRTPGEYIPTVLDVIGKGLYANKNNSNLIRHVRHETANGDNPIAIFSVDAGSSGLDGLLSGTNGDSNEKGLASLLSIASGLLAPQSLGQNLTLELRIYYNSKMGASSANSTADDAAFAIKSWLANPTSSSISVGGLVPNNSIQTSISSDAIAVTPIDLGDNTETRTPSSAAWAQARSIAATSNLSAIPLPLPSNPSQAQLSSLELAALFAQIVDVWAVYTPANTQTSSKPSNTNSQSSQSQNSTYQQNFQSFLTTIQQQTPTT